MKLPIKVRRLSEEARLPVRASGGEAGWNLHAAAGTLFPISPGERRVIGTGLALEIPPGSEARLCPRSGPALRSGLTVVDDIEENPLLDAESRNEIKVTLVNHGEEPASILAGERIAQLLFAPVERDIFWVDLIDTQELADLRRGKEGHL